MSRLVHTDGVSWWFVLVVIVLAIPLIAAMVIYVIVWMLIVGLLQLVRPRKQRPYRLTRHGIAVPW